MAREKQLPRHREHAGGAGGESVESSRRLQPDSGCAGRAAWSHVEAEVVLGARRCERPKARRAMVVVAGGAWVRGHSRRTSTMSGNGRQQDWMKVGRSAGCTDGRVAWMARGMSEGMSVGTERGIACAFDCAEGCFDHAEVCGHEGRWGRRHEGSGARFVWAMEKVGREFTSPSPRARGRGRPRECRKLSGPPKRVRSAQVGDVGTDGHGLGGGNRRFRVGWSVEKRVRPKGW